MAKQNPTVRQHATTEYTWNSAHAILVPRELPLHHRRSLVEVRKHLVDWHGGREGADVIPDLGMLSFVAKGEGKVRMQLNRGHWRRLR
eukprot:2036616-Heterocapsa_arctica.AAC.1